MSAENLMETHLVIATQPRTGTWGMRVCKGGPVEQQPTDGDALSSAAMPLSLLKYDCQCNARYCLNWIL